jgi:TM2 domain-containing membrane protein YozV
MSSSRYPNKSRTTAIVLALLTGGIGGHRFYLGDIKKGALYLAFFWTFIPLLVSIYDLFTYITNEEQFAAQTTMGEHREESVMIAEGVNGQVTLFRDRLTISRENIGMVHRMQHGRKGSKEIPFESITSVQLREPSSMTRGYIQFGQSGYVESGGGLFDATSDENTVLFEKSSLKEFKKLKRKLRELKKGDIEESTGTMDGAMEKLRERYAEGEIDEEEFETRKEILKGS